MIEINPKSNLLEEKTYRYTLQDVPEPRLFRDMYPYNEIPKTPFNNRRVPMNMQEDIWITDTTFRDGQQSRAPYTVEQMVDIYKMMHRLGGPKGIIRQTEFFVYSEKDREALERCMNLGYQFPEITTWIRASKEDFKLVKDIGIRETGILVSCSDYHIFNKLKMTRKQAMEHYLSVVADAIEAGLRPRCHFEDITRADFYGFVVPFTNALMEMSQKAGVPIKIRACAASSTVALETLNSITRSSAPNCFKYAFTASIPICSIQSPLRICTNDYGECAILSYEAEK